MMLVCTQAVAVTLCIAVASELEHRPVKVTLLVILADTSKGRTDPKLKTLAAEVQKREPQLTTFTLHSALSKSLRNAQSHQFLLLDQWNCEVTVHQPRDPTGRVKLTITPPGLNAITLECVCGKYLPIVTPKVDEKGNRLILAMMASPCLGK